MKGYLFPGQGAQFLGMGKDLYESSDEVAAIFDNANEILGFSITSIMFGDDEAALKRTDVTQPAEAPKNVEEIENLHGQTPVMNK